MPRNLFGALRSLLPERATPARPAALSRDAKASRVGRLVALHVEGRPVWTPRDYAALAREGFAKNPIVHRCVRLISEAAASVPLLLYEGAREFETHPLQELLARPNPRQTGCVFLESVYGHLLLAGNAYLEVVTVDGRPRELHALRPDRVRVVPGPDGWPAAFDYAVAGRSARIAARGEGPVAPVLHLALFHPIDDHYGLAPMEAAAAALDLHNAASAWTKALLDNAARPSGALVYAAKEGGRLSDEQFERLKRQLEDSHQGPRNAGRPIVLEGGLDWRPMALTPKDMDFVEAKRMAAREMALAFGVPPMLLGIPGDSTYANYREANRAFYRLAVLPLVARTAEAIAAWLSPAWGDGALSLKPDIDAIEALADERGALWARVGAATFLTDDEKRQAVGYGTGEGDGEVSTSSPDRSPA